MTNLPNEALAIDRWPAVSDRTGYKSKTHVERLEKRGMFPRSVKIGARAKGWVRSEITAWLEERIENSRSHDGAAA
ncbi:MAG: AlpA family phage regulatory protein [Gammaproteobacteria bacterium]|jgi:prophage regulatory protein|nr:AlpA family phage regulatory protein [Gammaproteobacteria bacterium]MBT6584838.1 AlpA family phage regulatory protein [Gammaproteobacteria bacterium]MBT7678482.1 AlpA family phage regulatory protein [Gammaproteobacteria bacterium]MBT7723966.1 AlpA family phage regulatory protein [Gammaproteobacteria bacterium]